MNMIHESKKKRNIFNSNFHTSIFFKLQVYYKQCDNYIVSFITFKLKGDVDMKIHNKMYVNLVRLVSNFFRFSIWIFFYLQNEAGHSERFYLDVVHGHTNSLVMIYLSC